METIEPTKKMVLFQVLLGITVTFIVLMGLWISYWIPYTESAEPLLKFIPGAIFFFIILHVYFQAEAVLRIPKRKPFYPALILITNLLLFFGLTLQEYRNPAYSPYIALAAYYQMVTAKPDAFISLMEPSDGTLLFVKILSIVCLALVVASWFLLSSKLFMRKKQLLENQGQESV